MPLIIITGTPCSGKTHRARQILKEFESRIEATSNESKRSVIYIPSYHASLDPPSEGSRSFQPPDQSANPRDQIYDLARLEKTARAEEFSAIKRAVGKNTVVIADAPNYIKGFRYQLFCEAKAADTRSVVVHTAAREDECTAWNNARLEAWGWQTIDGEEAQQNATKTQILGPRIGKDALGDLKPESHTAIYGDSVATGGSRSRSSSTGAAVSNDENEPTRKPQTDETMTLTSLYITDKNEPATTQTQCLDSIQEQPVPPIPQTPICTFPSSTTPSPRSSLPYSPHTLISLFMRYEPPSPFSRWDTPLFTIPSADAHPPYSEIWSAIFPAPAKPTGKKAHLQQRADAQRAKQEATKEKEGLKVEEVKQNTATILPTAAAPNALQLLESTTGEITKLVLSAAREAGATEGDGGDITITISFPSHDTTARSGSGIDDTKLKLELSIPEGATLSQPSLQRLRRKYTQIQRGGIAHGRGFTQGRRNIAEEFVRFLVAEWEGMG